MVGFERLASPQCTHIYAYKKPYLPQPTAMSNTLPHLGPSYGFVGKDIIPAITSRKLLEWFIKVSIRFEGV